MAYYQFKNDKGEGYGSCEIYHMTFNQAIDWDVIQPDGDGGWYINNGYEKLEVSPENISGWYWVAAFPGCLNDGEPMGPFATEAEAMEDANVLVEE